MLLFTYSYSTCRIAIPGVTESDALNCVFIAVIAVGLISVGPVIEAPLSICSRIDGKPGRIMCLGDGL